MEPEEKSLARLETAVAQRAPALPRLAAAFGGLPMRMARRMLWAGAPPALDDEDLRLPSRSRWTRSSGYIASLILFVAIPSLASILYLAFLASDQYVAEARFAVRSSQFELDHDKLKSAISSIGASVVPSLSSQDAYIIANYIRSRAIVDDLSKELDLRAIFQRPEADFWARLAEPASIDVLTKYWTNMVSTYVDGPSGIVKVEARAFRRDDALALSQAIIAQSEKLANEVSARARNDSMKRAEDEVRRSEAMVQTALADMRKYRDEAGYIDPLSSATSTSDLLLQTMAEKLRLQSDYFVASRAMSADAPTVLTLKTRLDSLDAEINELKSKLTGHSPENATIAASLTRFEGLELQRAFAEKLYGLAEDGLERARLKAEQQNIYVSVFVPPALPQDAKYPERLALSLLIPIGLLIVWGIFALIAAAVEDHRY